MMLSTKHFSSACCYFLPLRPKHLPLYLPFLSTLNILHMFHIHALKIIIIIIINIISFMQGIYTYIPETNHVPREYRVSAILSLLFMVSISLVPALALFEVCVQCPIWLFSVVPSLHGFLVSCLCIF